MIAKIKGGNWSEGNTQPHLPSAVIVGIIQIKTHILEHF